MTTEQQLTEEQKAALTSMPFDLENIFDTEIKQMIEALHARCAELGMPLLVATTWKGSDDDNKMEYGNSCACFFPGKRAPITFRAAANLIDADDDLDIGLNIHAVKARSGQSGGLGGLLAEIMGK